MNKEQLETINEKIKELICKLEEGLEIVKNTNSKNK